MIKVDHNTVDIQTENSIDLFYDGIVHENNLTPKIKEQIMWIRAPIPMHNRCFCDCVACQLV